MSDVTRIAGQAQTFTYRLLDAQNNPITPQTAPSQSIHSTAADAATGANPLSGPTTLTGSAGVYTGTYPIGLSAGTYYLRTVTALTASTTLTDVDDRLILQSISGSVNASPAPTPDRVHALIAQRPAFTSTSKPSLTEVQYLIDQRTADVLGELDGADVPANLFGLAQRTIALGVAADIESGYYPEQQLADSQHASLIARYLQALTRFQQLLAAQGGGPVKVGTMRSAGSTIQAWNEQATALGLNNPAMWPDTWYYGY